MKCENELVLKDLEDFPEDTKLYHMDGPLLVPHKKEEVKQKVTDKISFINKQLVKLDQAMKDKEGEIIQCNKKRIELQK